MRHMMRRLEHRAETRHGVRVDYARSYWTPPMPPNLALDLEKGQIEKLQLAPMVSLTDHDRIKALLLMQTMRAEQYNPISVEWSLPYGPQSFHLGIHNLPGATACEWMETLAAYTADPAEGRLQEILAALHSDSRILVVFNHPVWDLYRLGEAEHLRLVNEFLRRNWHWIHAIELNGLRSWKENQDAARLASKWNIVLISGGDRHGVEPNANINLTNADSFDEFVDEIRREKRSSILFLPQYAQSLKHRILQSAIDVVRDYPHFPPGSQRWDERVFHPDANGVFQPLRTLWPDGNPPPAMRWGIALVRMMGGSVFSGGLRSAQSEVHELPFPLEESEL